MAVEVKICGLTTPADVEAVNEAGADYAGFVFYEKSRRVISEEGAKDLLARLDPEISSVAVCVSPDVERAARIASLGFDVLQIHGGVTPDLLEAVRIPVWQALNLSDRAQLDTILYDSKIDGYLIDSAAFGSGKTFGWEQTGELSPALLRDEIRQKTGEKQFILAGGLTPENVSEGIRLFAPDVVDVSSGVEWKENAAGAAGGRKDPERVIQFVREVREV